MSFEHTVVKLLNGFVWSEQARPKGRDLVLGQTRTQHGQRHVLLREELRPMHVAIMGLSGVGKTYFIEHLIRQDIEHGTGFVVFDVHGDLADAVIAHVAAVARERPEVRDRLVLVEPFDPTYSIGFNPLELAPDTSPYLQAQELAHILRTRWETKSFGTRTEELLRNSLYALAASELTLVELPHLLSDTSFRNRVVSALSDEAALTYWRERYGHLSDRMQVVVREPLLTRVSAFLADPQVRDIVGQARSTFTFREAIQQGHMVIINLSKGRLGENSAVLGSLLFTKLVLDVMAQSRLRESERKLFTIYADEMQNLAGHNFTTLIAEARKYRVSVVAGHQFWHQLSPDMRAALLGVGSRVLFRLHYHDAKELAGELEPRERKWYVEFLTRLARGEAVFRSGAGAPISFRVPTHRKATCTRAEIQALRDASHTRHAVPRDAIRIRADARVGGETDEAVTEQVSRDFTRSAP
jgi:hypothetical protein